MVKSGAIARPKGMSNQAVSDFASTPRAGLPDHSTTKYMADGGSGHWMERAFRNAGKPGHSLRAATHTPAGENIPAYRVKQTANSDDPHKRKMANLAMNANRKYYGA